ncbi:hypothetical protein SLS62_011304 [Diatrype stigma]|uniref:Uncharacterized protein n=1 Tax=Diatrype stigma TaxID=117547 RepID=A0AAN9YFE0_9PEZI
MVDGASSTPGSEAAAATPAPSVSEPPPPPHHEGGTNAASSTQPPVILIDPAGDLLLDVTFETSKSALKAAKAAALRKTTSASLSHGATASPHLHLHGRAGIVRLFFRVSRTQLRAHSRYFAKLLDVDATQFQEARDVAAALARLAARGVDPAAAAADDLDLPRVAIVDDDEATRYAGRESVFADLLRILHGNEIAAFAAVSGGGSGGGGKDGDGDEKEGGGKGDGGKGEGVGSRNEKVGGAQKKKKCPTNTATTAVTDASPTKTTKTTKVTNGGKGGALNSPRQKQQQQGELQRQRQQKKRQSQQKPAAVPIPTVGLPYTVTLAVLADRFDCTTTVSRWLTSAGPARVKWPVTSHSPLATGTTTTTRTPAAGAASSSTTTRDGGDSMAIAPGMSRATEEVLRQKILVAWLLDQPVRFQNATRELIMNGSCRWSPFFGVDGEDEGAEGEDGDEAMGTSWWYLPDGLEQELQYRRHCILNTIGSIQQHFLRLYSTTTTTPRAPSTPSTTTPPLSRGIGLVISSARPQRPKRQQCQLGYDSSAACDSYQLGEMVKFLLSRGLLAFADCSPSSLETLPDAARWPVDALLAALRQCPAYQVDKHHANCGLRTRLLPILDFVRGLLSAGSVPVSCAAWRRDRAAAAWMPSDGGGSGGGGLDGNGAARWQGVAPHAVDDAGAGADGAGPRQFRFTRSLLSDQRLRFENALGADKFARDVFTASSWDWTAED